MTRFGPTSALDSAAELAPTPDTSHQSMARDIDRLGNADGSRTADHVPTGSLSVSTALSFAASIPWLYRLLGQFGAADVAGHDDVGEQQVHVSVVIEDLEGLGSRHRSADLVAQSQQDRLDHPKHGLVVLDQQDVFPPAAARRDRHRGHLGGRIVRRGGQIDLDRGALSGFGVHPQVATGLLDEAEHHAEAEAGAATFEFGGEERIERLVEHVLGHAGGCDPTASRTPLRRHRAHS